MDRRPRIVVSPGARPTSALDQPGQPAEITVYGTERHLVFIVPPGETITIGPFDYSAWCDPQGRFERDALFVGELRFGDTAWTGVIAEAKKLHDRALLSRRLIDNTPRSVDAACALRVPAAK